MRFYNTLADIVVTIHLSWIIFMCIGCVIAITCFKAKKIIEKTFLRTFHLAGIIYMGILAILDKPCLLTTLENYLRAKYNPSLIYTETFMIHYFKKIIYPDVNPLIIIVVTVFASAFTIFVFILKPPEKIKGIFRRVY